MALLLLLALLGSTSGFLMQSELVKRVAVPAGLKLPRHCIEEHRVKTRDGIYLTTTLTIPTEEECNNITTKFDVVMDRSPYGPALDFLSELYVPEGFAAVMQNQRGCFTSGGVYNFWKQDGYDAYDTMVWLQTLPIVNKINLFGASADGISLYADWIIPNNMIWGAYSMWATAFGHETTYWGGAYRYDLISHWLLTLGTCPNAPEIEKEVRQHESYDDWWAPIEANGPYGNHFVNVDAPNMAQAGWWDIFLQGQIDTAAGALQYASNWTDKMWFWIIPGGHCSGDEQDFLYPKFEIIDSQVMSVEMMRRNWDAEVFTYTKVLNFYVFGPVPAYLPSRTDPYVGNYYTSLDTWPVYTEQRWYLQQDGSLTNSAPTSSWSQQYTYDPKNPAPAIGANTLFSSTPCGPRDQAKVEARADVLKWTGPVAQTEYAFCGKLNATLIVSSSAVDTDFYVTVTDVYPNGGPSVNLRYGAIKMKWRDSPFNSTLMTPNTKYTVTVDLWSTAYIVNKGHQLRVLITSSRTPEFTVNPNNGCDLYTQDSCPTNVAQNTVYSGSYISLPIVPLSALPENAKIR